jgi:hypothetical protein
VSIHPVGLNKSEVAKIAKEAKVNQNELRPITGFTLYPLLLSLTFRVAAPALSVWAEITVFSGQTISYLDASFAR